jgi:hypothetical protein
LAPMARLEFYAGHGRMRDWYGHRLVRLIAGPTLDFQARIRETEENWAKHHRPPDVSSDLM